MPLGVIVHLLMPRPESRGYSANEANSQKFLAGTGAMHSRFRSSNGRMIKQLQLGSHMLAELDVKIYVVRGGRWPERERSL